MLSTTRVVMSCCHYILSVRWRMSAWEYATGCTWCINVEFTPSSRNYTLRPRGFLGVRFGKWHGAIHNDCLRYRKVSYCARNWPWYTYDLSILIQQIKSRYFFAHRQKCLDILSTCMPTAARCEPGISHWILLNSVIKCVYTCICVS